MNGGKKVDTAKKMAKNKKKKKKKYGGFRKIREEVYNELDTKVRLKGAEK